ncbi:MAG: alpha/beta hydrolase [Pseudomonadota bacterium]
MTEVADALALHCMMGRGRSWDDIAGRLGQRFTAPDLPGHGAVPWLEGTDYLEACIAHAEAHWGAERHLAGHSFGAVVCLHLAARHPGRVDRLTLIEPVLFRAAQDASAIAENGTLFQDILGHVTAGRLDAAAHAFYQVWGEGQWDALPARVQASMAQAMPMIVAQDRALAGPHAADVLADVHAPVLLIEGTDSPAIIASIQATLSATFGGAPRVRVPGAGHMVAVTHPDEVARAMAGHPGS